jgi:hypothetical protein
VQSFATPPASIDEGPGIGPEMLPDLVIVVANESRRLSTVCQRSCSNTAHDAVKDTLKVL